MSTGSRRSNSSSIAAIDRAVGLAIEVLRPEELGDLDDRVAVDQDRAEDRLLGLEALGRQAIDHGAPDSSWRSSAVRHRPVSTNRVVGRSTNCSMSQAVDGSVDNPAAVHPRIALRRRRR